MVDTNIVPGNLQVGGQLTAGSMTAPDNSVADAAVQTPTDMDDAIDANKVKHENVRTWTDHELEIDEESVAKEGYMWCASAAGTIVSIAMGSVVVATGDNTLTIDVKKNGTTILSSTVVLDSSNTNYIVEDGTLSVTTFVDGDVFTVHLTLGGSSGAHAKGAFIRMVVQHSPEA